MKCSTFTALTNFLGAAASFAIDENNAIYGEICGANIKQIANVEQVFGIDGFELRDQTSANLVGKIEKLAESKLYAFNFARNHFDDYFIYSSENDFLVKKSNFFERPNGIFIGDIRFLYCETTQQNADEIPQGIKNYLSLIELVEFLQGISEFPETEIRNGAKLFFVEKKKLVIDLNQRIAPQALCSSKIHFFNAASYNDEDKRKVFKVSIIEFLCDISSSDNLSYLVENFDSFICRFENNYHLFLIDFSLEEEKEKFRKRKLEYLGKINALISDVQAKSLTVPIAFFLFTNQLKDFGLKTSTLVLTGMIMYFFVIRASIKHNEKSASELSDIVDKEKAEFEAKQPVLFLDFQKDLQVLKEKCESLSGSVKLCCYLNWSALVVYLCCYLYILDIRFKILARLLSLGNGN